MTDINYLILGRRLTPAIKFFILCLFQQLISVKYYILAYLDSFEYGDVDYDDYF